MILVKLCMVCVLFSISAGIELLGDNQLQPGLIQEFYNVFNNLSNLATMPHLMETPECRRDCEIYRQALHQNEMWAAEMFDANGRPSLGILKGNLNQWGNMDQCVSSSSETSNIEGKFCFIKIHLKPLASNLLFDKIWKNAFNFSLVTSKPYEKSIVPTSDMILTTLCVPSSCTSQDLMIASRKVLSIFNHTTFGFEIHVDDLIDQNCAEKQDYHVNNPIVNFVKSFIYVMIGLVFCATVLDILILQNVQNESSLMSIFSKSFSLQKNYRTLMTFENDTDSVSCLNWMRAFNYLLLFALHYGVKFAICVVDRSDNYTQIFHNPIIATLAKNATIALDLLIFSSGISQSYKITKFLKQDNMKSVLKSMLYKYLRLLAFWVIFFAIQSTAVNKTMMHLLYIPAKDKINIWSILFCYENFLGIPNMYFGPVHSFYTDIQLYFICCIVLMLTRRYVIKTKLIFFIAFVSLFCRSLYLYFHPDILAFAIFGQSLNQLSDMMTFMYTTPLSRLPVYLSGVALGYHLRINPNYNLNLSSLNIKIGWAVALFCLNIAIFSYYPMDSHYKYSSFDGAVISFINSFCWLIFLIWMVTYCEIIGKTSKGKRSVVANIFVVWNRLTPYFSALHLLVLYYCLVGPRLLFEFKLNEILGFDYFILAMLVSAFVMLFIHLPLKNTWNNFIPKKRNKTDTNASRIKNE